MIIGINGFKGAGKNVVGEYLEEQYGFEMQSFAALLKQSAAALFGIDPKLWDELKNDPRASIELDWGKGGPYKVSAREFLQRYGTESHRDVFGHDFWVEQAFNNLEISPTAYKHVFTDARFENELAAIREKGGKNIQIMRPETDQLSGGHASEVRPDNKLIDAWILNSGTLDNLYDSVDSAISRLYPEIAQ